MSIKTNELQQIIAPQSEDSILLSSTTAGTGQFTLARAAAFFGAELVKPSNPVGASLSQKAEATRPSIHQLPALNGYESTAYYFKTQEDVVTIFGIVGKSNGTFGAQEAFAEIPEGFGTNLHIWVPAVVKTGQSPGASMGIQYYGYTTNQISTTDVVPDGTSEIAFVMTYVATK